METIIGKMSIRATYAKILELYSYYEVLHITKTGVATSFSTTQEKSW